MPDSGLYIGIDMGTSGCRAVAIDAGGDAAAEAVAALEPPRRTGVRVTQDPALWWRGLGDCLAMLNHQIPFARVRGLAIAATSGTLVLCDAQGAPLGSALMYNDARAQAQAAAIRNHAPPTSGAHGATSSLAKLLWRLNRDARECTYALHQADWLAGRLTGRWGIGDYNNALKLGYDPVAGAWPAWLDELGVPRDLLPRVLAPGDPIGPLRPEVATKLGLPAATVIHAGTTDGVAGFVAAGADAPGDAVTSLGSTLILKLLSPTPVFSPPHGVYSHRLGELWLAGGASNAGGDALRGLGFSDAEMTALTPRLEPGRPTGLDYYPLPGPGERFPVNDPSLKPKLTPPAADRRTQFQALLEGLTRIEAHGYRLLHALGAPKLATVRTVGSGAGNPAWTTLRARALGVPILNPRNEQPAYGAALLAAEGLSRYRQ